MLSSYTNYFVLPNSRNKIPHGTFLISAGEAAEATEDYELLDINELVTGGKDGFAAFTVTGDSMVDDIKPGDTVFVDTFAVPADGDIVALYINGKLNVKFLERKPNCLTLVSANKKYEPRKVTAEDSLEIIGVVTSSFTVHKNRRRL